MCTVLNKAVIHEVECRTKDLVSSKLACTSSSFSVEQYAIEEKKQDLLKEKGSISNTLVQQEKGLTNYMNETLATEYVIIILTFVYYESNGRPQEAD